MINTKTLERFIFWLAAFALISPLVFFETSYIFPFIVPKILYFRIVSALMLGAYLVIIGAHKKIYGFKPGILNIAVGLFFVSMTISTFVGVDWYKSMWDSHERMLGLFTIFHYIAYYFVVVSMIKEWKSWRTLLSVFLTVGIIVMLLGFWQRFVNPEALLNRGNSRVSATLGNPIYYSAYGMFLFFMGVLLYVKEKKHGPSRIIALLSIVFGFLGLFLGGSRGMLVGTIAGLAVAFILYWIHYRKNKKLNLYFGIACAAGLALFGLLYAFRTTPFVSELPAVGRLLNTRVVAEFSNNTRVMAWGVGIDAWQDRPVFGWGPNNYFSAFNAFYRPQFLEYGWNETWFDNAHNVIVNTLAVQGAFGLITYLLLFVAAFYMIVQGYRQSRISIHEAIILGSFVTAHFVSNIFIFENPTSYLYFFFSLGLIHARTRDPIQDATAKPVYISTPLIAVVGLVTLLFIYATDINPARANRQSLEMVRSLLGGQKNAIELLDKTLAIPTPHIDDVRADFARSAVNALPNYAGTGDLAYAKELMTRSFNELEKNKQLHPTDVRTHIDQASIARRVAQTFQDASLLPASEQILEEALTRAPGRQQIVYMLAYTKSIFGKHDEAIALLDQAVKADPKIGEGWWRLANAYWYSGNLAKAKEIAAEGKQTDAYFDDQGVQSINYILQATSTTPFNVIN